LSAAQAKAQTQSISLNEVFNAKELGLTAVPVTLQVAPERDRVTLGVLEAGI